MAITKKFVINTMCAFTFVNDDLIVVENIGKRLKFEGKGVALVLKDVVDCFDKPNLLDDVIGSLSVKYGENSLEKLLDFLVERNVLVDAISVKYLEKYEAKFIDKTLFYTLGGKSLDFITTELKPLSIGIIGHSQFVNSLLNNFVDGELLSNFNIAYINKEIDNNFIKNSSVNVKIYSDILSSENLELLIDKSDFVVVSSDFNDYNLFGEVNKLCIEKNKRWLRVIVDGCFSEIGPLFIPNKTSCYECLCYREKFNSNERCKILGNDIINLNKFSMMYSIYPVNKVSSCIVFFEIMKYLSGFKCNLLNQVVTIDYIDFEMQSNTIFRNYMCPVCSAREGV